jgi:hypothetical protein
MRLRLWLPAIAVLLAASSGCSTKNAVTGGDPATAGATQSETSGTTTYAGGKNRIVVAYNDETNTGSTIAFTQTTRVVTSGTSLMGWSFSLDGTTWVYGGKLAPPKGWAILWGDPAMTTSGAHYNIAFLANLAVPNSKYPQGGVNGSLYYGDGRSAYIGGACFAKSTDGGQAFAFWQCIQNTDPIPDVPDSVNGHFYDGGSMASGSSGEVFAAYNDVAASNINVWRAADENSTFQRLPDPFPGMVAGSHARLRVAQDGSLYAGAEFVTAQEGYLVYLNRYSGGSWGKPVQASNATVLYPAIDFNSTVQGSELTVRTGPQFGFDIGATSVGNSDAVRLLYTQTTGSRLYISAAACPADLSICRPVASWGVPPPGPNDQPLDAFDPDVKAWVGFIGLPPSWQGTWVYRFGASPTTVNVARQALVYINGNPFGFPVDILQNAPVCSDTRGYFGDYDDTLLVGFKPPSATFMRFVTDSSAGCTKRWEYTATAQHVKAVQYDY